MKTDREGLLNSKKIFPVDLVACLFYPRLDAEASSKVLI